MKLALFSTLSAATALIGEGSGEEGDIITFNYDASFDVKNIDMTLVKNQDAIKAVLNSGKAVFYDFTFDSDSIKSCADYTIACDDEDDCKSDGLSLVAQAIGRIGQETTSIDIKSKGMERLNCADGMNGGCSHFCTNNQCSCPSCWLLGPDLQTCGPEPNKVAINCESSDMNVTIDQCVLQGQDVSMATLDDGKCTAKLEGNNWVINTDLDGCGTEFNLDNDSEIIDFKNALTMAPEIKHGLVMTRQVSLDFQCRYDTSIDDISAERTIIGGSISSGLSGSGGLTFDLTFFTGSDYATPIDEDTRVLVGEKLYYNVAIAREIAGLHFSVLGCTVSDEKAAESYKIYKDMCVDKYVDTTVNKQSDASEIRFTYNAFQFASAKEDETREVLTCRVLVCDKNATDSVCSTPATCNTSDRFRRSISDDIKMQNAAIFEVQAQLPLLY